ncbi:lysophospholipid acyltransferase family protein [Ghiorsea bivora]|uniref:lysophospholipid acyltransferase family protein n=1 Tax=Ghiorsea bivora TaxID=1485545 RepID=UPI00056F6A6C|nr:lysophospholipid acyltransferase family protein [Ghiorsea bivora]
MKYIQAILFYFLYIIATVSIATACILARVFGRDVAWKVGYLWSMVGNFLLKLIYGIKVVIEGKENIPDEPCVIVANHQSTWETATLPVVLPPFAWILKKELMYIPFFGWALYALDAIPIVRSNTRDALRQVNEKGTAQLKSGRCVVIFPEGTRRPVGQPGTYKPGAVVLAKKAGVAILPIAHNAGACWPKDSWFKHKGTITLRVLPPISAEDVQEKKRNDILAECETRIVSACKEIGG